MTSSITEHLLPVLSLPADVAAAPQGVINALPKAPDLGMKQMSQTMCGCQKLC